MIVGDTGGAQMSEGGEMLEEPAAPLSSAFPGHGTPGVVPRAREERLGSGRSLRTRFDLGGITAVAENGLCPLVNCLLDAYLKKQTQGYTPQC